MFKRKNKKKNLALLAFAAAFVLWGGNTAAIKIGLEQFPVFMFLCLRYLIAGFVMLPFALKKWKKIQPALLLRISASTVFVYVLAVSLVFFGIEKTGGVNTSLLYLLAPVVMFLFSMELLKEKFNAKILTGLIVSLAGSFLIAASPLITGATNQKGNITGNLMIIISIFAFTFGAVLIKPVLKKLPALQMTTLRFLIGGTLLLPLAIFDFMKHGIPQFTISASLAAGYVIIFASILAFSLYHFGFSQISGEESSVLHYLDPVFGVIVSILILGETITPIMLLGAAFALSGIYLAEIKLKHRHFLFHHKR